jgi:hypothetical protein
VYEDAVEKRFVSSLSGISAGGDVLRPGLITERESDNSDANLCPFYAGCCRYCSPKGFVSRSIFTSYFRDVVFPYIYQQREQLGNSSFRAFIIYDGHKSHLSDELFAAAAENGVTLFMLPPHSSHLLQALDKGFFKRVKTQFTSFGKLATMSKISSTCERIHMAMQASTVTLTIWHSWSSTGIIPVIEEGVCTKVILREEDVLLDSRLAHAQPEVAESARGRHALPVISGVLNAEQMSRKAEGKCPFCASQIT